MTAYYKGLRNDMGYFADFIRYMDSHLGALFVRHEVRAPDPTTHARPLPATGPPFPVRAPAPPAPPSAPQSATAGDPNEEVSEEDSEEEDEEEDGSEEASGSGSEEDGSESDVE